MKKVLFVCLGNICRSPMGEGAFIDAIENEGLTKEYIVDSAGTAAYHVGELPDQRMRETALSKGITLKSRARQAVAEDFDDFDLILAMDRSNYKNLEDLALKNGKSTDNLKLMREFDTEADSMDVPDPYYGGQDGFEEVFEIMHRSSKALLLHLQNA